MLNILHIQGVKGGGLLYDSCLEDGKKKRHVHEEKRCIYKKVCYTNIVHIIKRQMKKMESSYNRRVLSHRYR